MATSSYKMGPGKLLLGATPLDISAQVTNCVVTPSENVTSTDAVPTLDGGELAAEEEVTFSYVLSGSLVQDLTAAGVINWSWDNAGEERDFVFVPNTVADRGVQGTCVIVPLAIGGDVKSRPTADFSFRIVGTPVFGVYDNVSDEVDEDA